MRSKTYRRIGFLVAFAAYFAALWFLWETPVVYPLKVFVVLLHELSHAAAVLATGGTVERILLTPAQGGATYARGGSAFITLSAGYLGSLACGLALLGAARARAARVRSATVALAVVVLAAAAVYVRGWFGFLFCLLFGGALLLASRKLKPGGQAVLLTTLGLTSALYAVLDIRSDILQRPHLESDAHILARMTGIPTLAWGALWMVIALLACAWSLHRAWRRA